MTKERRAAQREWRRYQQARDRQQAFLAQRPAPDLPELDGLYLRQWMPGETRPPEREHTPDPYRLYSPDGVPSTAPDLDLWYPLAAVAAHRQQQLAMRGQPVFRNRHRLIVHTDYVLGIDLGYGDGPPLIYETMVFSWMAGPVGRVFRYATLAAARYGHRHVCHRLWTAGRR